MPILCSLLLGALPVAPAEDKELFTLYIADAETFFAHEKDAGLLNALQMINARLAELPGEIPGGMPVPPEMISLATGLLTGEKSLRIGTTDDPNMPFPIYGQLDVMEGDEAAAQHLAMTLMQLGQMAGVPFGDAGEDGLSRLNAPVPVEVVFGAKGSSVVLSAGKTIDHGVDLSASGLPEGVDPSFLMMLDLGGFMGVAEKWLTAMGQADQFENPLAQVGMGNFMVRVASGCDSERSYTISRMRGHSKWASDAGLSPRRNLTAADINLIPQSATFATVSSVNFGGTLDFMLSLVEPQLAQQGMDDPVGMLAAMTGFNVKTDLFDNLGDTVGFYTSDATGGGGLLSLVGFVELSNPEGMLSLIERLEDIINGMGASAAQGYVRTRTWEHRGNEYISLAFPGLPVPAEPTLSISGNHLFFGMTPGATVGAVESAQREGGLSDNARFQENLPRAITACESISFADSPRLLRHGYGLTSLICSGLVNGTRSRFNPDRDAGMIMPTYPELARGAKASVWATYVDGDDYVSEQRADSSVLVNLTSTVGLVSSSPLMLLIPAALVGTATSREMSAGAYVPMPVIDTADAPTSAAIR